MKKRIRLTGENDPLTQTDQVLAGFEQLNQSTSQPVKKSASQQARKLNSQEADLLKLKKSTFQLSSDVLGELDKFHLNLQLELGKTEAPYKEVIVEEAIARFLLEIKDNEAGLLSDLKARQKKRDR